MRERSAGIVVFREKPRKYLLLITRRGSLDFPKGKIEKGESPVRAALRETFEETGLRVQLLPGFKRTIRYVYIRPGGQQVSKTVVFFLARSSKQRRVKVSREHKGFTWLSPTEADRRLKFKNAKLLIKEAERFLGRLDKVQPT